MKTPVHILLGMAFLTTLAPLPLTAEEDKAYIQTRTASIQTEPKLLARSARKLSYGDSVVLLSSENGWAKVRAAGTEGFIHTSALSSRKIELSGAKGGDTRVTDADVSLAGKGFSPEIERALAAQNKALNFKAVDAMERQTATPDQVRAFMSSGKLNQNL